MHTMFCSTLSFSRSCTGSESDIVRQKATVTLSKKYKVAEIQYAQHSRWKNSVEKDSQINCQLRKTAGVNTRCKNGIIQSGTCTTELWIVLKQLLCFLKEWDIIISKGHKGKGASVIFSEHIKSMQLSTEGPSGGWSSARRGGQSTWLKKLPVRKWNSLLIQFFHSVQASQKMLLYPQLQYGHQVATGGKH